jgi:hypothetical protein
MTDIPEPTQDDGFGEEEEDGDEMKCERFVVGSYRHAVGG